MHPVDLLAPVSPISWDNIALRGVTSSDQSRAHEKRLNSTVYGYTFLLATLQTLPLVSRQTGSTPLIPFRLSDPLAQRLRSAADLGCYRCHRTPLGAVLPFVFKHHPHRSFFNLW